MNADEKEYERARKALQRAKKKVIPVFSPDTNSQNDGKEGTNVSGDENNLSNNTDFEINDDINNVAAAGILNIIYRLQKR